LDHTVQRIVDQGFSIEQAEYALRVNRNNVDRALKSLQRNDNKNNRLIFYRYFILFLLLTGFFNMLI
jgi:hypothetical protein